MSRSRSRSRSMSRSRSRSCSHRRRRRNRGRGRHNNASDNNIGDWCGPHSTCNYRPTAFFPCAGTVLPFCSWSRVSAFFIAELDEGTSCRNPSELVEKNYHGFLI